MNLVVLVAMQRTGSTLLARDLTSMGLGLVDEHLLPIFRNESRSITVVDFVQSLMRGKNELNNVGLKLMVNHSAYIYKLINGDNANYSLDNAYVKFIEFLRSLFDNIFLVSINRSKLEQCVSSYISYKTRLYHIDGSEFLHDGRPGVSLDEAVLGEIDFEALNNISMQIRYEAEYFEKIKSALRNDILNIQYNQVVRAPDDVAHSVMRKARIQGICLFDRKLAPRNLRKIVTPQMFDAFVTNVESQAKSEDKSRLNSWRLLTRLG